MVDTAVRASVSIARGDIEAGLSGWRQAAHAIRASDGQGVWPLELISVCVVAHAKYHQLDKVADLVADLPDTVTALVTDPNSRPAVFPACGAALLAIAMTDLDRAPTLAARTIALAQRLRFLRGFQPIMSVPAAEQAARNADRPAYDDAVSCYAGLDNPRLRTEILTVLGEHRLSGSDPA
jgi:hypothetical protein